MKLDLYLKKNGIKRQDFAALIGVSPQAITWYCDGKMWISKPVALRLVKATGGQVTPNDLLLIKPKNGKAAA